MRQPRQIKKELSLGHDFKSLTKAYQEYAIQQINYARDSVLASRTFVQELVEIFYNVKSSYRHALEQQARNPKKGFFTTKQDVFETTLQKNGKDVLVLITANNKLYGDIVHKVIKDFLEVTKDSKADLVVVGKQGKIFFEDSKFDRKYTYFEIPDTNVSTDLLHALMKTLINYETVRVFYGKYNNMVSQEPVEVAVSGDLPTEEENPNKLQTKEEHDFLFEPTLENVLHFFESQIFYLILDQTISESQLGKFASRINAMERAQQNMDDWIIDLKREQAKMKSSINNKKQQEQLAGRRLWGGRK